MGVLWWQNKYRPPFRSLYVCADCTMDSEYVCLCSLLYHRIIRKRTLHIFCKRSLRSLCSIHGMDHVTDPYKRIPRRQFWAIFQPKTKTICYCKVFSWCRLDFIIHIWGKKSIHPVSMAFFLYLSLSRVCAVLSSAGVPAKQNAKCGKKI